MKKSKQTFATKNEIQFLERLGSWSEVGVKIGRATCLRGYLQASLVRTNWGDINKIIVVRKATTLLLKIS